MRWAVGYSTAASSADSPQLYGMLTVDERDRHGRRPGGILTRRIEVVYPYTVQRYATLRCVEAGKGIGGLVFGEHYATLCCTAL